MPQDIETSDDSDVSKTDTCFPSQEVPAPRRAKRILYPREVSDTDRLEQARRALLGHLCLTIKKFKEF